MARAGAYYESNNERPSWWAGPYIRRLELSPQGVGRQGPAVRAGRTIETCGSDVAGRLDGRGTLPIEEGNEERVLQLFSITASRVECDVGQATKGAQWMPWQHGPKKGVVRLR